MNFQQIENLAHLEEEQFRISFLKELKGLIQVNMGIDVNSSRAYETYNTRQFINENQNKYDGIKGWIPLITNLKKIAELDNRKITLTSITTEKNDYLYFTSLDLSKVYGILQFTEKKLERKKELTINGNLRGTWTNCIFYDNGKIVKSGI